MRVLVVDDDAVIVRLLQLNLELEGHEVVTAADGRAALQLAVESGPDVVLLDVMMPYVDGFEVCEQLRSDPRTDAIPVVFVSARAQATDVERGMAAGAVAYVTKPFDPLDLIDLIDRLATEADAARNAGG